MYMDFIRKVFGDYLKYYEFQFLFLCGLHLPTLIRLCGEEGEYILNLLTYLLFIFLLSIPAYLFFCIVAYITDKFI